MLPSAAELGYFLEVSQALNLSRAAERLGISQPSLSLAMKRLEQAMGTPLLVRHKQGVTLTQAGKQLGIHAKQLLQYWQQTKARALASQHEIQGNFVLGCHSSIALHLLPQVLPTLLNAHPKLMIQLTHDVSRKITEQVVNLSVDIGIVVNPFRHPDLIIKKLCDDEVTFWKGPGNKPIQNIHAQEAVILCDPDLTQTVELLKKGKKWHIVSERIMTMNSLEAVASLTASGCGIGVLPSRVAMGMYPKQLKRIQGAPVYSDEICLVYRDENRDIEGFKVILEGIRKMV